MLPIRLLAIAAVVFFLSGVVSTIVSNYVPFPGAVASCFFLVSVFLFYTASDISWLIPVEELSGVPKFDSKIDQLTEEITPHMNKPLKTAKEIRGVQNFFTAGSAKMDAKIVASGARDGLLYVFFGQIAIFLITLALGYVGQTGNEPDATAKDIIVSFGFSIMAFLIFAVWWVSRLMFVRRKLDGY